MNNDNKNNEFDELQENLNRIDLLTKRLVLSLANKNNESDCFFQTAFLQRCSDIRSIRPI